MFLFFIVGLLHYSWAKLNVTIFIESQCPDTHRLIQKSLKNALFTEQLDRIVNLKLVPYGNANQTELPDETWSFECQHGEVECYGNLMEVCALDILKGFYKQLTFIECMHSKSKRTKEDYDYDGKKCMAKFYCLHERVLKCMDSKEGNYLLHRAGRETDSLQPKKTRIPWILVDGKHDEEVSQLISADFVGWACQNYEGDERIKDCRKFLF